MGEFTGGEALAQALAAHGVEVIFGLPGLHTLAVYDALYCHPQIRTLVVRHEGGAAMMADGYARATGRPGVCLTIPGPGIANALAGLGEAYGDSSPVLLITGQIDREDIGQERQAFHEYRDQSRMIDGTVGWRRMVRSAEEIPAAVTEAFRFMAAGRPQPAVIEIPRDVGSERAPLAEEAFVPRPAKGPAVRARDLAAVQALLAAAKAPLILAGQGVVHASATDHLIRLAEILRAPVVTTYLGRSAFPEDHPLSVGSHWSTAGPFRETLANSDLLFVVGSDLGQKVGLGSRVPLPPRLIHLDISPEVIGRHFPADVGLVGDLAVVLPELVRRLETVPPPARLDRQAALRRAREITQAKLEEDSPLEYALMRTLRETLPRDAILTLDACLINDWLNHAFEIYEPRTCFTPSSSGALGFALPAALGAKVAYPERTVVAAVGDGGFLFTSQELATARRYGLNPIILLFNDGEYRTIRYFQERECHGRVIDAALYNPDFVAYARAFGCNAVSVSSAHALQQVLLEAMAADVPTVIELPIPVSYPAWRGDQK